MSSVIVDMLNMQVQVCIYICKSSPKYETPQSKHNIKTHMQIQVRT